MDRKFLTGLVAFILPLILPTMDVSAGKSKYVEEEVANGGSVSGVVQYEGPPKDVRIDLMKEKNGETCSKHPEAKDGVRFDHKILSSNGLLQNAVVFIENIGQGKAWRRNSETEGFTMFHFKNCDISPPLAVIRKTGKGEKTGNLTVTTHDGGVLHNPIGYLVSGARRKVLFNKPLSSEVLIADATKSLKRFKRKDKHFFLQCGQHNYMEAEARIIWNPYFFITDANGSFKLDQVPAGKYKVTAWHPYAGEHTQEIIVAEGTETLADFAVKAEKHR
ncbi:MAG: carboxypeptidase regulatory-like domain-containing protein [Nitrospina sp.]|nr:carboxypeptidase regulatory-like domain-containing protein [Nitrospina sp.]MBT3875525.1 carboxypeptidase regulatory-like domain-containing protein [Nitrospina sp.]MBT4047688.1 carboxypeptidase regulatory-like domain-containing protein [Nitrospina sp.]MBT4556946.1 carboxypeptidase regulatory-like domain-containing protein [Nitrospina sp.]MBT5350055.1 carboxypeptidase regulatory-like domain-containing protein [Nitrospina sp.]